MVLRDYQKERIKTNIFFKKRSTFKTEGNFKIYENVELCNFKNSVTHPAGRLCNSIVYNEYSQLKKQNLDFNLYVGCVFKCYNFFNMGGFEKKLILYRLEGREDEEKQKHSSFKILRQINKFKREYENIYTILEGMFYNVKYVFFTYTKYSKNDNTKYDLIFIFDFLKHLKFLQASYITMKELEKNNNDLILHRDTRYSEIFERIEKMKQTKKKN